MIGQSYCIALGDLEFPVHSGRQCGHCVDLFHIVWVLVLAFEVVGVVEVILSAQQIKPSKDLQNNGHRGQHMFETLGKPSTLE